MLFFNKRVRLFYELKKQVIGITVTMKVTGADQTRLCKDDWYDIILIKWKDFLLSLPTNNRNVSGISFINGCLSIVFEEGSSGPEAI